MEHSVEEIAPLRHWYINANEKSNKYKSSLLSSLTKSIIEKPLFMSCRRSAFNVVNDWALRLLMKEKLFSWQLMMLNLFLICDILILETNFTNLQRKEKNTCTSIIILLAFVVSVKIPRVTLSNQGPNHLLL